MRSAKRAGKSSGLRALESPGSAPSLTAEGACENSGSGPECLYFDRQVVTILHPGTFPPLPFGHLYSVQGVIPVIDEWMVGHPSATLEGQHRPGDASAMGRTGATGACDILFVGNLSEGKKLR